MLTAEATHRSFILDDSRSCFRKVFTLGQFAAAGRRSSPTCAGRELVAAVGAAAYAGAPRARRRRPLPARGRRPPRPRPAQSLPMLSVVVPAPDRGDS